MKLSRVLVFVSLLLAGVASGTAEAVMVDFELPDYTAGGEWVNVDGWIPFNLADWTAPTLVTPSGGETAVLSGSQSGRLGSGTKVGVGRFFDSGPITSFATGDYRTVISCLVQGSGTGGTKETIGFNLASDPVVAGTHAGIQLEIGGNIKLFGNTAGYLLDSGVSFVSGDTYKLELELNVSNNSFKGYATNLTAAGSRTYLGSLPMVGTVTPELYPTRGFALTANGGSVAVFDDFDVYEVAVEPTVPLLPNPVSFEQAVYVAGSSVIGKDGWYSDPIGAGTNTITTANKLQGTKSLQMADDGSLYILGRNFAEGTTYGDGSIISARMKLLSSATQEGQAEFHYSHNLLALTTPAGIVGKDDGNFWIFGKQNGEIASEDGIDTGIPFLTNTEYLLEMQMDFTNELFYCYATDITNSGQRISLGVGEFWYTEAVSGIPTPDDTTNSGYFLITRTNTQAVYDDLNVVAGTLPDIKPGDANRNGRIDENDAAILAQNWLVGPGATWDMGDFNKDGYVNDIDATLMATNWTGAASASVPEPSTLIVLIGLCIGALLIRRK